MHFLTLAYHTKNFLWNFTWAKEKNIKGPEHERNILFGNRFKLKILTVIPSMFLPRVHNLESLRALRKETAQEVFQEKVFEGKIDNAGK